MSYVLHVLGDRIDVTRCGRPTGVENDRFRGVPLSEEGPYGDMCEECWMNVDPFVRKAKTVTLVAERGETGGVFMFTTPIKTFLDLPPAPLSEDPRDTVAGARRRPWRPKGSRWGMEEILAEE